MSFIRSFNFRLNRNFLFTFITHRASISRISERECGVRCSVCFVYILPYFVFLNTNNFCQASLPFLLDSIVIRKSVWRIRKTFNSSSNKTQPSQVVENPSRYISRALRTKKWKWEETKGVCTVFCDIKKLKRQQKKNTAVYFRVTMPSFTIAVEKRIDNCTTTTTTTTIRQPNICYKNDRK